MPAPFNGLGVQANLAFVDSEAILPVSEERVTSYDREIRFPRQSDKVANLALTYEKQGFFLRVAATYQGGYLFRVGDEPAEDIITGDRVNWDISSRYALNDRWRIFANFKNITDQAEGQWFRGSNRLSSNEYHSWSAQIGLDFRL